MMALLFSSIMVTVTVNEAYAKCIDVEECTGGPIVYPLKDQIHGGYTSIPDMICSNPDHVLTERPNGDLACVTEHTAERTGWHIHYRNTVDTKAHFSVAKENSMWIFRVPFEITGATLDDMTHENQVLTVTVTPYDESGMLSLQMSGGFLDGKFEYCDGRNAELPDAPYVVIRDGIQYEQHLEKNSRDQPALNIPITENSKIFEIARTCY